MIWPKYECNHKTLPPVFTSCIYLLVPLLAKKYTCMVLLQNNDIVELVTTRGAMHACTLCSCAEVTLPVNLLSSDCIRVHSSKLSPFLRGGGGGGRG